MVVFAMGIGTAQEHLKRLEDAFLEICERHQPNVRNHNYGAAHHELHMEVESSSFVQRMTPREAFFAEKEL